MINKEVNMKKILKPVLALIIFFFFDYIFVYLTRSIFHLNDKKLIFLLTYLFKMLLLIIIFKDAFKDFKDFLKNLKFNLGTSFKYFFIALGFAAICNIFLTKMGLSPSNQDNIVMMFSKDKTIMFLTAVIMAPIIEEIVFRESFRDLFEDDTKYILFTGILFGAFHLLSATNAFEYLFIIPYSALGIALSMARAKTGTIYSSITVHIFNNLISSIFVMTLGVLV